jgi:hypothetical protein
MSFFGVAPEASEILRPCCRPRLGRTSPKVELTPRVLLLPLHRHLSLQDRFTCSMHVFFCGCRGPNILSSCYKATFLFPLISSIKTCLSVAESFIRARVTSRGR